MSSAYRLVLVVGVSLILLTVTAFLVSSVGAGQWPMTSARPVEALERPNLLAHAVSAGVSVGDPFRLVVFGDQRALADGEWQTMNRLIADRESALQSAPPLIAIVDTGDIVLDGSQSDQYPFLTEILQPLSAYPYLVGFGNHEVQNNVTGPARDNLARFLGPSIGDDLTSERLYYRRDVAGLCLLFLDTNEFIYTSDDEQRDIDALSEQGATQLQWLVDELAAARDSHMTIAILHHPLVSSSIKHHSQSARLWNVHHDGRSLAQILAEGGVDLVLTGHTHTYERFHLTAPGGESFQLVNVSGRPQSVVLGLGHELRAARDLEGQEVQYLREHGWNDLEGWEITQRDMMPGRGANQWLDLTIIDERIEAELFYLVDDGQPGIQTGGRFVVD